MTPQRRSFERLLCYIAVGVCSLLLLKLLAPLIIRYFSPFLMAIPFAALIQPLTRLLEKKLRFGHTLAVLLPVLLLFVVLTLLLLWFGSFGINQLLSLLRNSDTMIRDVAAAISSAIDRVLANFNGLNESEIAAVETSADRVLSWLTTEATNGATGLIRSIAGAASRIPYGLIYANFVIFGIYFIAKDYDGLKRRFYRGRLVDPHTDTGKLTQSALTGLMGFIRVQAIYAIWSLFSGFIFWSACGYQYAMLIALGAAILEFLPVVGNGTVYIPWAIIALVLGDTRSALLAAIYYGAMYGIRRVTEPRLLSQNIGVSPLVSLMSMFAGLVAGGVAGMMGGPAIATLLTTFWRGSYRRTMEHDINVIRAFLHDRWRTTPAERLAEEQAIRSMEGDLAPEETETKKPLPKERRLRSHRARGRKN